MRALWQVSRQSFAPRHVIAQLQQMSKQRTSETYRCTLKSFMQFREDNDVLMYEAYLRGRGLTKNSASFYMRILRAVYNRAVKRI